MQPRENMICMKVKSTKHQSNYEEVIKMSAMPTRNPEEESDKIQKQVRENSTFPDSDGKNYKTNFIQSTMDLEEMVRDSYKT